MLRYFSFLLIVLLFISINLTFCLSLFIYQYQARETPHAHSLICVSNLDGIRADTIDSALIEDQNKVKKYVKRIVSANLVSRIGDVDITGPYSERSDIMLAENDFNWNPSRDYFSYECHPLRVPFDPSRNYERSDDGLFADVNVQRHYRRLQIANQFHRCCFTCFKYCFKHDYVCRFGFPWVANGCASKAEEPDKKLWANIYAKKISYLLDNHSSVSDRQRLYAVGSAILGSSPVGSIPLFFIRVKSCEVLEDSC